jgi:hypothetical protein
VPSVRPAPRSERQVAREVRALLAGGARLRPAGAARRAPRRLLSSGYTPKHLIELLGTRFYLANVRRNADILFFVAYVVPPARAQAGLEIFPRIFYKDGSLVWRSASHFSRSHAENWIGKGDVKTVVEQGEEFLVSAEETTDLPLEMQSALEALRGRVGKIRRDDRAVALVLRRAPDARIEPYPDFTAPRRRAQADPRNLVHGGRPVARFARRGDPASLRFVPGYEPDFAGGLLETSASKSRLYGGLLRRFRILSRNRRVQYLFFAGPRQAWIGACQATTTELSSFGVRTIDVAVDDDLLVPGYEYHYLDTAEDPAQLVSQIPAGFVGERADTDEWRADASPWLDRLPVIREFRRALLARGRGARRRRRSRA